MVTQIVPHNIVKNGGMFCVGLQKEVKPVVMALPGF